MSNETQTFRIDPSEMTAGDNTKRLTPGLTTAEAEAWLQALDKLKAMPTDKRELKIVAKAMEALDEVRVDSMAKAEGFHAGVAGIPLRALKGETNPGDPDHVPSLELKDQKL